MANTKTTTNHVRGKTISDVLRRADHSYSKDDCVFAGGQAAKHVIGQVMKLDGSDRQVPITAAADTPSGVILYELDATTAGVHPEGWLLTRQAELVSDGIVYFSGATQGDKDAINQKLTAMGLPVRTSV